SRRRHTRFDCDWSSDVCSSDLMSQLGFEPIFDSYIAVGLIALVLLALLAIKPQFGALTPRRKIALTALRLAVVLLAIAALLRPRSEERRVGKECRARGAGSD